MIRFVFFRFVRIATLTAEIAAEVFACADLAFAQSGITNLGTLPGGSGWNLGEARDISANGMAIVGTGSFNGAERGWLVTLVPEPASAALMVYGTVALCARRRYQQQRLSCGCGWRVSGKKT